MLFECLYGSLFLVGTMSMWWYKFKWMLLRCEWILYGSRKFIVKNIKVWCENFCFEEWSKSVDHDEPIWSIPTFHVYGYDVIELFNIGDVDGLMAWRRCYWEPYSEIIVLIVCEIRWCDGEVNHGVISGSGTKRWWYMVWMSLNNFSQGRNMVTNWRWGESRDGR